MRALRRPPPPATLQCISVPAPMGGLNTIAGAAAMPEGDCLQSFNMVASDLGLRSRLGRRHHTTQGSGSRTLIPYMGSAADGSKDRLFATNFYSMYNVTTARAAGTSADQLFTWPNVPANINDFPALLTLNGYGVSHAFVTTAGHFLLYCDEVNGLYVYTESTDTWAKVTQGADPSSQISGVDPATFCFVIAWKSRLWFVEKNSANVWYLPAGAVYGTATKLNVDRSAHFRHGGGVRALASWTLDGGIGIDDHLVAIGDGGDVAVYKGTDPASPDTFGLKGVWHAGGLVAGRNVLSDFGGDVLILTKSGIRPLSQLTEGQDGQGTYVTAKVANLFNRMALAFGEYPGWALYLHPEDNALLVTVPALVSETPTVAARSNQTLAMSLWNRSWSRYRDIDFAAAAVWRGKLYFGDSAGVVWVNDGYVDYQFSDPNNDYDPVQWQVLTPFRNGDGKQKKVELIRPMLVSEQPNPAVSAAARYNYDLSELADVTEATPSGDTFDSGVWGTAVWGDDYLGSQPMKGATGVGNQVAISVRGAAVCRTTLVSLDVFLQEGGYL